MQNDWYGNGDVYIKSKIAHGPCLKGDGNETGFLSLRCGILSSEETSLLFFLKKLQEEMLYQKRG